MSKSIIYQTLISLIIVLILFYTYFAFFYKKNELSLKNIKNEMSQTQDVNSEVGNKIDDIYYISTDKNGNSYEIIAESGMVDEKSLEIIKLKNVKAVISIKNSGVVYISAINAIYNRDNLNTYFYDEAKLNFKKHLITSDNIDMNYVKKNIKIAGDVKYLNDNNLLNADIIEMNMVTKISKIYMKNKNKKVTAKIFN